MHEKHVREDTWILGRGREKNGLYRRERGGEVCYTGCWNWNEHSLRLVVNKFWALSLD
jgi:hypothetical protein